MNQFLRVYETADLFLNALDCFTHKKVRFRSKLHRLNAIIWSTVPAPRAASIIVVVLVEAGVEVEVGAVVQARVVAVVAAALAVPVFYSTLLV